MDCRTENIEKNSMVPLSHIVAASITDTYSDYGKVQASHTHWGARGLRLLMQETPITKLERAFLPVNKRLNIATLPVDFNIEQFVGYVTNGKKFELRRDSSMLNECMINTLDEIKSCPVCHEVDNICNDLELVDSENVVNINGTNYVELVSKKIYPNGDYFQIKETPVLDMVLDEVKFIKTKEFIVNYEVRECGCFDNTEKNKEKLKRYNLDIYNCYYTECNCGTGRYKGRYVILEERGILQLEPGYPYDNVYIEYVSYLHKEKGRYMVPSIAFETLVEWIKYKAVADRLNIPLSSRAWQKQQYVIQKNNMEISLARRGLSLGKIVQISRAIPGINW